MLDIYFNCIVIIMLCAISIWWNKALCCKTPEVIQSTRDKCYYIYNSLVKYGILSCTNGTCAMAMAGVSDVPRSYRILHVRTTFIESGSFPKIFIANISFPMLILPVTWCVFSPRCSDIMVRSEWTAWDKAYHGWCAAVLHAVVCIVPRQSS